MAAPVYWESKDPDEAKNYSVDWAAKALAAGDTILTSVWVDVVGAVVEADDISVDLKSTYARVAGGVDGVPASLTNRVTTANGETLEQVVILPIVTSNLAPLGEYEIPTPAHLVAMYPAFADVNYGTIAIHIQNAATTGVDTSWLVGDYAPAVMALAAHNMALLGIGAASETEGYARAGVTAIRDGAFNVQFSERKVADASGGKWAATPYGQYYESLLSANKGGPRVIGAGGLQAGAWGFSAIQNNGVVLP